MARPMPDAVLSRLGLTTSSSVVVVWHTGCSTSRLAIPYWQRLQDRHPEAVVYSVSQDEPGVAAEYAAQHGLTMKRVDGDDATAIARALQVNLVPAYWLLQGCEIVDEGAAWDVSALERFHQSLSPGAPTLITAADAVPSFKPG